MTTRTARRLAIALTILYLVLETVGLAFQFVTGTPEDEVSGLPGDVVSGFTFLVWSAIGGLIASRRPGNAIGWVLSGIALQWAISDLTFGYASYALEAHPGTLPAGAFAALTYNNAFFLAELLLVLLFLLFPDGRALSRRWRLIGWVALGSSTLMFLGSYIGEGEIERFGIQNPYAILPPQEDLGFVAFLVLFATVIASVIALIVRLRRARGDERQQLRWFVYASAFLPVSFAFFFFGPNRTALLFGAALLGVAIVGIPVSAAIAIFKYRLYDVDVVIGKTVVVAVLAAFATAVYLAVVVGIGALVGSRGGEPSVLLAVVATAVVAVAFQPVRQRAQRLADRVVYGERANPYDVLSDFSERLAGAFATQDLLPTMARMLAEGTGAARADVWLRAGDRIRPTGWWPPHTAPLDPVLLSGDALPSIDSVDLAAPVRHQGELLGAVTISKKPGEQPTPIEERLVADLAAQAGLVLSNARLIEDLRASRQRLVAAQDEERRKIERNLHDGAQQQLVALAVKQRLAEGLIERDPQRARGVLTEAQADTVDALETLRDLARGSYPPILADRGLAAALQAQVRRAAIPVQVHADGVERYEQEAEAAAYFCCLEALQNVTKYAAATAADVRLGAADGRLTFIVSDDGAGFDPSSVPRGTGLQGMADRLEALGGGLEIRSQAG